MAERAALAPIRPLRHRHSLRGPQTYFARAAFLTLRAALAVMRADFRATLFVARAASATIGSVFFTAFSAARVPALDTFWATGFAERATSRIAGLAASTTRWTTATVASATSRPACVSSSLKVGWRVPHHWQNIAFSGIPRLQFTHSMGLRNAAGDFYVAAYPRDWRIS